MTETPKTATQRLNRREALKALAAAGGALTAAAFLPGKWARPLVETGVLPVHAQSSRCQPPYTWTCPAPVQLTWDADFFVNFEAVLTVDPPCQGIMVCAELQFRAGEQVVRSEQLGCGATNAAGSVECFAYYPASVLSQFNPRPTQMVFVASFQNRTDGTDTCSAVGVLPAFPDNLSAPARGHSRAGIK